MTDEPLPPDALTIFVCGPNKKCEHDYAGWIELDDRTGTSVCTKCGHHAIDDAVWL